MQPGRIFATCALIMLTLGGGASVARRQSLGLFQQQADIGETALAGAAKRVAIKART